jgi:hypothetical protein
MTLVLLPVRPLPTASFRLLTIGSRETMTTDTLIDTARAPATPRRPPHSSLLALSALGVVFGNIGASLI